MREIVIVMLFECLVEGKVTAAPESDTTANGKPFVRFTIEHEQGYHDAGRGWVTTGRTDYRVTCWDKRLMPALTGIRRGQRVLVRATRFNILNDNDTGEPIFNLTPDYVRVLEATPERPRQRDGHMVRTAHGEDIHADKYPDVVTNRDLIHHR
ncbi:single-stranded DNA-binding protein [Paractinoplanes globisporus]|uniref:Single-stranded DNA-binding protein n=1 Tax=Paractinoplanes globisporus TaxID=113565 RepID=A0ABW6WEZ3_9ACTN|nr:single-stranded DNA-binding protein [Actinoplanes globisporus]